MNILFYNWNSNSEEDLCETFECLGYQYTRFSHSVKDYENDSEFWEECKQVLQAESYDCIFSFDYFPILSNIAKKEGIPYISWIYDCPHYTLYSDTIYNECNRIFFFDKEQYLYFKAKGLKNGFYMPLAVNVKRLEKQLGTDMKNVNYQHEISFVGSLYNNNLYKQIHYLPENVKGYLEGMIAAQSKIYGYNFIYEMMTPELLKELNRYISFDDSSQIRIPDERIYADIVNKRITELDRIEMLNMLAEQWRVDLYTNFCCEELKNVNVLSPVDYRNEMPVVFRHCKINLNISLRSITSGIPLRALDICGSGGFLISNYQAELAEHFAAGKEMILYDSKEDLKDKVSYYLSHDEERIEIAVNGYRKVKEVFSYEKIVQDILDKAMSIF